MSTTNRDLERRQRISRLGQLGARILESTQIAVRAGQIALTSRVGHHRTHSGGKPHLLIVSWTFPPDATTAAQLPAFLARHASRSGWRVSVACGPPPASPTEAGLNAHEMMPESVRILRARGRMDDVGEFHPQVIYRLAPGIDGGFAEMVSLMSAACRGLASDPPSHVLATGPAFGNFVVGMRLAQRFKARLCLQYRDEWTVMRPSFVSTVPGDVEVERECLRAADLIWFVNNGQRAAYQGAFGELREKRCMVIPHGWDPEVMAQVRPSTDHLAHLRGTCVIVFAGRATDATPMGPFLLALGNALEHHAELRRRVVLHVTGRQTSGTLNELAAFSERYPGAVELQAAVPQSIAIEIMREATAVLLLNNTTYSGVVPLKTTDYLASGAPILVYGETGGAGRMIRQVGAGIMVPENDAEALAGALVEFSRRPREEWDGTERDAWCREHNRATLSDKALGELLATSTRRPAPAPPGRPPGAR